MTATGTSSTGVDRDARTTRNHRHHPVRSTARRSSTMSTTVAHRQQAEVTLDTQTIEVIAEIEAQVVAPVQAAPVRISWAQADTGLWVANYGGYYGGTVDRQGTHFFVSDTFGEYVGDFRSLDEAKARLSERLHVLLPDVIRPTA
ncbi:hypothetical protein KK095_13060 [Curtobacterium flaccumfaciens pv. flaccumfaciens]|nr:hypothetical protein [Curtobacterium flaccumfaciens pv. flaccumfaciens]